MAVVVPSGAFSRPLDPPRHGEPRKAAGRAVLP